MAARNSKGRRRKRRASTPNPLVGITDRLDVVLAVIETAIGALSEDETYSSTAVTLMECAHTPLVEIRDLVGKVARQTAERKKR